MTTASTGQHSAIIYTLVECAKRHGHNPEAWLTDVLERLPSMSNQDGSECPAPVQLAAKHRHPGT